MLILLARRCGRDGAVYRSICLKDCSSFVPNCCLRLPLEPREMTKQLTRPSPALIIQNSKLEGIQVPKPLLARQLAGTKAMKLIARGDNCLGCM